MMMICIYSLILILTAGQKPDDRGRPVEAEAWKYVSITKQRKFLLEIHKPSLSESWSGEFWEGFCLTPERLDPGVNILQENEVKIDRTVIKG